MPYLNVSYDPAAYFSTVQSLLDGFVAPPDVPTLINYMGFTRDLGLNLAVAVLAEVQPTLVIEVLSKNSRRNFQEPLQLPYVQGQLEVLEDLPVSRGITLEYGYVQMWATSEDARGWELEPRTIREMCVLGYISAMLPDGVKAVTDCKAPIYK